MTKNLFLLLLKKNKKHLHPDERERAEKLAEIGAQLRRFREEHSIGLERVAIVTMIRSQLLQAIEEGQIDQLPEPVYTQGLIRRYAEAMGLDSEKLADSFPAEPEQATKKPSWPDLPGAQLRPMHLYLFYVFLIICSVNGLSQLMHRSEPSEVGMARSPESGPSIASDAAKTRTKKPERQARLVAQSVTSPQATKPVSSPTPPQLDSYSAAEMVRAVGPSGSINNYATAPTGVSDSTNVSTTAPAGPVTISVTVQAESWVQIEIDGKTEFEGTLPQGTQRTWQAKEQLVVVAGNAGGVLVAVNNGQAQQLGAPGAVKEAIFKASNPQPSEGVKNQG